MDNGWAENFPCMLAPILCDFIIGRDNSPVNCAPTSSSFCTTIHCSCGFLPLFFVSVHATHAGKRTSITKLQQLYLPFKTVQSCVAAGRHLSRACLLVAMGRALFSSPPVDRDPDVEHHPSIKTPSNGSTHFHLFPLPCCPMSYEQIDHHTYRLPPPFLLTRFPLDNARQRGHFTVGSMGLACAWSEVVVVSMHVKCNTTCRKGKLVLAV